MSEMRQELNGVKKAVTDLAVRTGRLETTVGKVAVEVSGHTERLVRIEAQLKKIDKIDRLMNSFDLMTSELLAMRSDRLLMGRSFSDQQAVLGDHEVRLTRLELRDKKSS
jgi:hypothetical protein